MDPMSGASVERVQRVPYAKHAGRRAAIIEAAAEVFAARGYHAGSFQQVADRVGMSQSSLFHYFPTKRDLLLASSSAGTRSAPCIRTASTHDPSRRR